MNNTVMENTVMENIAMSSVREGRRNEAGMTTAEYTVGTLGACSVAAVLIKIAQTEWFGDLVKSLLENIVGIAGF